MANLRQPLALLIAFAGDAGFRIGRHRRRNNLAAGFDRLAAEDEWVLGDAARGEETLAAHDKTGQEAKAEKHHFPANAVHAKISSNRYDPEEQESLQVSGPSTQTASSSRIGQAGEG